MKKLLITGFDPFGGAAVNPSWLAVERLRSQVGAFEVHKRMIPTVFGAAAEAVLEEAEKVQPDVILCVGQAGGREAVTPERIAVNIRDARIPDNAGNQPRGEFVVPEGPAAYFATVPVEKMAESIRQAGIPATVSNSAGAFVCNDVMYTLLHHYAGTAVEVGFIHVPYIPEQGNPNLPLEKIVMALERAIAAMETA
jgi:pyroglutamyl-peptidase